MREHPLIESMNRQQAAAITAGDGPVLVLAGPGSGKTSVLTRRIAWLIREHRVPHHRIMAVTFTNKAAGEMRSRVEGLLGDRLRGLQIGTFHATCARFLRREAESAGYRPDYIIYDSDDQVALVKRVVKQIGIDPQTLQSACHPVKDFQRQERNDPAHGLSIAPITLARSSSKSTESISRHCKMPTPWTSTTCC